MAYTYILGDKVSGISVNRVELFMIGLMALAVGFRSNPHVDGIGISRPGYEI
jgi:hypothetical protein